MSPARFSSLLLAVAMSTPAFAQERVVQAENVRLDYAQVLNVEPVYQTLRASRTEQQCEEIPAPPRPVEKKEESVWTRMVGSVKGVFSRDEEKRESSPEPVRLNCRTVPVEREFRRPIAYDVDYVYKGVKYRSRLAEDPGNRLRIRISVMPYVPEQIPVASGQ
ncbi:hypothetical protein [Pseudoxanthomonas mexicana]|uniref:hypothetical protein n=1 Tax=Pseudoxanthomonas mexicana TaxID=128785 RepID=UPI00398A6A70